ncbi:MAG: hypothetical protein OHK0029_05690 [Armatimonadaceae bacterium]
MRRAGCVLTGLALLGVAAAWWTGTLPSVLPRPATETLEPGVSYQRIVRRKPHPLVVHIVTVDLSREKLRFQVTPRDQKGSKPLLARTTSEYLREAGAQLAINGDFFDPWWARTPWDYYPHSGDPVDILGRACSNGNWYSNSPRRSRRPTLFLGKNNRAHIGTTFPENFEPYNALSGHAIFLRGGDFTGAGDRNRHPRSVVALDEKQNTLYLVVADGRQRFYSDGATLKELAEILKAAGADTALNLDGGGSSTLVYSPSPGKVRVLNRPIQTGIPGRERPIANHLAVFLK